MPRSRRALTAVVAAVTAAAIGCAGDDEPAATPTTTDRAATAAETSAADSALPQRDGPRRETTGDVPHVQLDAAPVAEVDAELRRRAFLLPGVEDLPSDRSLPGARGLAFTGELELARPDVISGSREFAHIHPDGSLHVWLPVARALEVDRTEWGEIHPWVGRRDFWDGVVMVYTPESLDELEVTIQIIVDAYNFVTGASVEPADIA